MEAGDTSSIFITRTMAIQTECWQTKGEYKMNKYLVLLLVQLALGGCGPKVTHQIQAEPIRIEIPEDFTVYQSVAFQKMYQELVAICLDLYSNDSSKLDKCKENAKDTVYDAIEDFKTKKEN
jgi:hypothetical protein